MTKILVTGAGGFLGRYLCAQGSENFDVVGVDLSRESACRNCSWRTIGDERELASVVQELQPALTIHAAFVNRKPPQWSDTEYLQRALATNVAVFETIAEFGGRLLVVSSSAVYGTAEGGTAVTEVTPIHPVSLYGLAKAQQEQAAQYFATRGLELSIARLFNLCGPGQRAGMLLPDWVSRVVDVTSGKSDSLEVRHTSTSRDFVDVRDAARALWLLTNDFHPDGIFNVASGCAVGLWEVAEELRALCPRKLRILETQPQPGTADVAAQFGSYEKLRSAVGWQPTISWQSSLRELYEECLQARAA